MRTHDDRLRDAENRVRYVRAAFESELERVRSARDGSRNSTLYDASQKAGQFIEAGELERSEAEAGLIDAASACGLVADDGLLQVKKTIGSAFRSKVGSTPRDLSEIGLKSKPAPTQPLKAVAPSAGAWPDPTPLDRHEVPELPIHIFPPVMRRTIEEMAAASDTPPDLGAAMCLGALGAVLQTKYLVRVADSHFEPPTNYFVCAYPPSGGKTFIRDAATLPLRLIQAADRDERGKDVAVRALNLEILRDRLKATKADAARTRKGKTPGRAGLTPEDLNEELTRLIEQVGEAEAAFKPLVRFSVSDPTIEAMVAQMAGQGGATSFLEDELGAIASLLGGGHRPERRGVIIDVFKKAWSGSSISQERTSVESREIERSAMTIAVLPQPDPIRKLLEDETYQNEGLAARFNVAVPRSRTGYRQVPTAASDIKRIEPETSEAWAMAIADVWSIRLDRQILDFSAVAQEVWRAKHAEIEPHLRPGEKYGDASAQAYLGKLMRGNVLRFAAMFFAFENPGSLGPIGEEYVRRAQELASYYAGHYEALGITLSGPIVHKAKVAVRWLKNRKSSEFNVGELQRTLRDRTQFATAAALEPVIELLENHGYIPLLDIERTGPGKPPRVYAVNPKIMRRAS